MNAFITILIILGCLGLILFVLVQNPKGGGLNSEFGSAVQLGGAKRATDILEKGTWYLAVGIAVLCLYMAIGSKQVMADDGTGDLESNPDAIENVETAPTGGNGPGMVPTGNGVPQ